MSLSKAAVALALSISTLLTGCTWRPLYGPQSVSAGPDGTSVTLRQVYVDDVDTRVGQQVRNHLIFLLQGGKDDPSAPYVTRLRVRSNVEQFAAVKNIRDFTAGNVSVTVSYDLLDRNGMRPIASGTRVATAPYDRTSQSFANSRAVRDAENRAAREVAEQLRLAIAADLAG